MQLSSDGYVIGRALPNRQEYLEYLSELCILMKDRYNGENVWGDRMLHDDVENQIG